MGVHYKDQLTNAVEGNIAFHSDNDMTYTYAESTCKMYSF
jgi:hypothetical protein